MHCDCCQDLFFYSRFMDERDKARPQGGDILVLKTVVVVVLEDKIHYSLQRSEMKTTNMLEIGII